MAKRRQQAAPYRVFISHATIDKWIAIQLDKMIQGCGIATYRDDRDLQGGAKIGPEIRAQLQKCQELLVLWSAHAKQSEWVEPEIGMAYGLSLHIVPVRHGMVVGTLPPQLRDTQSPELTEIEIDKYLHDLVVRAREWEKKS